MIDVGKNVRTGTKCPLDFLVVTFQHVVHSIPTGGAAGEQSRGFIPEDRVDIHQNARTTPASRAEPVARVLDDDLPVSVVTAAAGVCPRTVRTWIGRYQAEGLDGLADRSSRPHRQPRATPVRIVARITALRLQRQPGIQIARTVGVSPATVSRVLRRAGLHRLNAPQTGSAGPALGAGASR